MKRTNFNGNKCRMVPILVMVFALIYHPFWGLLLSASFSAQMWSTELFRSQVKMSQWTGLQPSYRHCRREENSITNVTTLHRQVIHRKTNASNQAARISKKEICHDTCDGQMAGAQSRVFNYISWAKTCRSKARKLCKGQGFQPHQSVHRFWNFHPEVGICWNSGILHDLS